MSIKYEKKGNVGLVILDRPEKNNAMTIEMWKQLEELWEQIRLDSEVWAVILTGNGDHFTVGTDIKELSSMFGGDAEKQSRDNYWKQDNPNPVPDDFWKPLIGAFNGYCFGIGFSLAIACDIVIATPETLFSFPEVKIGLPAAGRVSWWLPKRLPLNIASEIILTGKRYNAEYMQKFGLVNYLVSRDELIPKAEEMASDVCKNAPLAVSATKECLIRGLDLPVQAVARLGESYRTILFHSEDAKEGPLSFVEKRPPQFKAR